MTWCTCWHWYISFSNSPHPLLCDCVCCTSGSFFFLRPLRALLAHRAATWCDLVPPHLPLLHFHSKDHHVAFSSFFPQVTSLCWQHMCPTSHQHTLMGLFVCTGKTSFSYRLLVSFLGIFCTRKKCHYHRRFFKYPLLWWCLIVNWTTSRFNQRLN